MGRPPHLLLFCGAGLLQVHIAELCKEREDAARLKNELDAHAKKVGVL